MPLTPLEAVVLIQTAAVRIGIERRGGGDRDVIGEAVESQGEVELAGGPCGSVHQGRGIATAGGIDGRQADSLVELPVPHEPRVEGIGLTAIDASGSGNTATL